MTRSSKLRSVIVGTLVVLALYAFCIEPSRIRVVEYDVAGPDGRGMFPQPLRIAVIADLHAGAPYIGEAKIERVVALTNAARPDLILLAGDYVIQEVIGGEHIPIETVAEKLRGLRAPLGVFAVLGNHDRWENARQIARALEAVGIPVLENRSAEIGHSGNSLHLVGLSDAFTTTPNVAEALAGVPRGARALCFTHSPDVFPNLPAACALTIAAHTHGGQVWLPLLGRPIVPSRFGQRYAAGLVRENEKVLFVSTGIGTSIIPVSFGVVPEVSVLNVRP
jgi:predicted MPP superfamily phosphohydrolase